MREPASWHYVVVEHDDERTARRIHGYYETIAEAKAAAVSLAGEALEWREEEERPWAPTAGGRIEILTRAEAELGLREEEDAEDRR